MCFGHFWLRDGAYVYITVETQNFDARLVAAYASARTFMFLYLLGTPIPISGTIGMALGTLEVPKITQNYQPHPIQYYAIVLKL